MSDCSEGGNETFKGFAQVCLVCGAFVRKTVASPCPKMNATSWLLAPRDADARGVFVVSYAMKRWRYAWRRLVLRIMWISAINCTQTLTPPPAATCAPTPAPSSVIEHGFQHLLYFCCTSSSDRVRVARTCD